ncbi:hypothetical protein [Methanobacterium sp.]|uniref:hypothetical protein n=1 Tax=Methanobacterium sp. TaxID=2164 RepID=UPI002ABB4353|nr:hypothetical protein [Methanobacterium sp.]MDY9922957.1 hypothetical protein [Methanobacterium sp.]
MKTSFSPAITRVGVLISLIESMMLTSKPASMVATIEDIEHIRAFSSLIFKIIRGSL